MKVFIQTLGCEKNTVDSEKAAKLLTDAGCTLTDDPFDADCFIVNTCGFIKDAKQQSIETIFDLAREKTEGKKLIVTGCLSQRYAKELAEELPEVDAFLGVNDYSSLASVVLGTKKDRICCGTAGTVFEELGDRMLTTVPWTRSVKIAEGCSSVCSYCAIPFIRGLYRSRMPQQIINEAKKLAQEGCKELVIIAQNVTHYGKDLGLKDALPDLLRQLCRIDGLEWIRLMYCYEDEISSSLIEVMKTEDKICNYIDIPIQHISDRILKDMNRKSTSESIRSTVSLLRKQIPNIAIRTTFIVGFPGETREEFEELRRFTQEAEFDRLGVFTYSREEGTRADRMPGQVRKDVKERRLDRIMQLQREISLKHNQGLIGKTLKVLTEEQDDTGAYTGRCYMDAPDIDNSVLFTSSRDIVPGSFVNVLITDAFDYDICGKAVFDESSK